MPWIRDSYGDLTERSIPDADLEPQDSPVLYYCDECGAEIREGEEYYSIDGMKICENCMDSARRYAGVDYDD